MFNPHNMVKTAGFLCLCKIKHWRLLQLFALLPQSIPAVSLVENCCVRVVGDETIPTTSAMVSWTALLLFQCSTVARHINVKGKENRWLFFCGDRPSCRSTQGCGREEQIASLELPEGAAAASSLASEWAAHFSKYLALLIRLGKNNFCSSSPTVADFCLI